MSKQDWLKLALIAACLAIAVLLAVRIDHVQGSAETEIVRSAIKDAALTCYAVEGAYPDDVAYLRDHYHLAYDQERYLITYESFASNLIPDIWVTERGAKRRE